MAQSPCLSSVFALLLFSLQALELSSLSRFLYLSLSLVTHSCQEVPDQWPAMLVHPSPPIDIGDHATHCDFFLLSLSLSLSKKMMVPGR